MASRSLRQTLCDLCVETMRIRDDRIAGESRKAGGGGSRSPLPPIGVRLSRRVEDAAPYPPRTRHNAPSTKHQALSTIHALFHFAQPPTSKQACRF